MKYWLGFPRYFYLLWLLGALVGSVGAQPVSLEELDYGFNESAYITDCYAIELHSNANFSAMAPYFAYAFTVDREGNIVRYVPTGSNIAADDFSKFPVSYHAGKGVPFASGAEENMNLKTVGIGLLYGLDEEPSEAQLIAAAQLITMIKTNHTEIKMVAGQTAFSGYRMTGITVCNETRCWLNPEGLIANPWNFPMDHFVDLLNNEGSRLGISWQYLEWANWNGNYSWSAKYALSGTVGSLMV